MKRSKRGKLCSHYEKVFPKTWPKKANQSKRVKPKCGFFRLFHTKTTSNQITKVGFLKDDLLPVQPPRWLSRPIDWMWSCPWKRMVSRLCRKETFILYIYLSIFYHVRFPGGCYSLNPNSNPQNSIHFGSQAIEKHFHLFVLPHLSESTFLIMYQPRYKNLHLSLFVVPPLWSIRKCLLRKGITQTWGLIPCHGYGIYRFGPDWQLHKWMGRNHIN